MDLILIDNIPDAIAVKTPYCARCVQEKLSVTILKRWNLEPSEYMSLKDYGLKGYNIKCECKNKPEGSGN